MQQFAPTHWKDYALLDSGGFEKLEQFGPYRLARPEPQAVWDKQLPEHEWDAASARYVREKGKKDGGQTGGEWLFSEKMPFFWWISYEENDMRFRLKVSLSASGHVGVFPEQAGNWAYIYQKLAAMHGEQPKVLNLFAYTGAATLAARAAGAAVTHLDAIRGIVNWASENAEANYMDGISWVVEDAPKFVAREVKRGKTYQGIVLDPPAYGRGPGGEKWVLEEGLNDLVAQCSHLLDPEYGFFVLNLYSLGLSPMVAANLALAHFPIKHAQLDYGECSVPQRQGETRLPLGTYLRFSLKEQ